MPDLVQGLQSGAANLWFFLPTASLLGALHGLEPGHSKTMMAAFIVAIRGTIPQAVLLGLSAAISHSCIIWVLAALALNFGSRWNAESAEPYLQMGSAVFIIGLAGWMFYRTRREIGEAHAHSHPAPHADDHGPVEYAHPRDHEHADLAESKKKYEDAHERAHAQDIAKRFAGRTVTTSQIILFGITGGLMPCPAAFTVLLVCLQLKRVTLGFAMVAAFSLGLAVTMVAFGAIAAWSVQHAQRTFSGFGNVMRRAPYVSSALLVVLAGYMAWHGWSQLN